MLQLDITLYVKNVKDDILIVQVYVDDTIFGSTIEVLYMDFSNLLEGEYEMSMMGELTFFLRTSSQMNEIRNIL